MSERLSHAFVASVSGRVSPGELIIVAVVGEQRWRQETEPALKSSLTKVLGKFHYTHLNIYAIEDDPVGNETGVDFFLRMHRKGRFTRIFLYRDGFEIFKPGETGEY